LQTCPAREARLYVHLLDGEHTTSELTVHLKVRAK